ncbi:hypothetical protein BDY24DRAFT_440313 [Mrakia frigida]|uniref:uncharacterized protein n=1 Tax=Mrakia frigida TaxID=29902 RepID=UPI003FCC17CB
MPELDIPLLDMEPTSSPLVHRRKTKKLTPCRFCLGVVVLFVGASFAIFFWTIGKVAYDGLVIARNPHLAHHHPVNESIEEIGESNLVRSFYGEAKDGGVNHFDLIASIYHRVMVKNETEVAAGLELEGEEGALTVVVSEEDKGLKKEEEERELVWGPWERIFSEVVLEGLTLKSKGVKTVAKITIPGRLLPSLRNSTAKVDLKASFTTYPSSLNTPGHLIPINSSYYLVRNASDLSLGNTFPAPWPLVGNTIEEQNLVNQTKTWKRQLLRFAISQNLLREVIPSVEEKKETPGDKDGSDLSLVDEAEKEEKEVKGKAHAIVSRSMVTMVQDSSVYALAPFKKQMEALGESQKVCNLLFAGKLGSYKLKGPIPDCQKLSTFAGRGHFDSLFEMGTEEDAAELREIEKVQKELEVVEEESEKEERQKGAKGWRYGPFIQASFGSAGPADLLVLGNGTSEVLEDEPDFSFDWHLTFSTSSPLKVALGTGLSFGSDSGSISSNRSAHDIAGGQDTAELLNALIGHPFNPSTRPLLRKSLQTFSSILTFFSVLIQAHFWITRSVTTGISIPAQVIDSVYHYIWFIWQGLRDDPDVGFWVGAVFVTGCSSVVWSLALRLEFSWWGWVPVWVSRRKATHLERASTRLDMRFDWKQRGLSFLVFLAVSLLIPKLPYLIHASPPKPLKPPPGAIVYTDKTWYLKYLGSLNQTSSLILFASQFLLNQRAKTFGANYRFVAAIDLLSSIVHAIPVLLSSRWGRWELMDPWEVTDLLAVALQAAYAWQAWNLPEVKQEEEEDE